MKLIALERGPGRTAGALRAFLEGCRPAASAAGRPILVSISLEVGALDPLAVLESIFEPGERHFYAERPEAGVALAGAEEAFTFTANGPDRFAACQGFMDGLLGTAVAIGDLDAPLSGPHFLCAFAFEERASPGAPFEGASVLVPRWQVGRAGGRTVAVANLAIASDSPVDALVERVWRAHSKFRAFDYTAADFAGVPAARDIRVTEEGAGGSYAPAVAGALSRIARGELQKVVLARAKDLAAGGAFHPLRVLNGLRQRFPDCYAFSVANGRGQSFIGASPERLLRVRGEELLTEAQAGSVRRGASASEDAALAAGLARDDKELREHALVTGFIDGCLRELGITAEIPASPAVRRLANVQHLHTPIRARLAPGRRLLDVLARLHPTPAVGGTPREAALRVIAEGERFERGLYAGALGWVDFRGDGEFLVALRSALIDGDRARIYAGAGIVAGSEPGRELAETELKFRAMQEALLA
jgi:menaquinone-specific isochorismate synthase